MNAIEFRVGRVLRTSFSVWLKNLLPFTLLAAIVLAPAALLFRPAFAAMFAGDSLGIWRYAALAVWSVLTYLVTGAVVYGAFQQLRGRRASAVDALVQGVKRMPALIGVGILLYLVTNGGPLLVGALSPYLPAVLAGLGAIAAMIVQWVVTMMTIVTIPATVVERPGILGALRRSRDLTSGYKGRIFGLHLVLLLVVGGVGIIGAFATGVFDAPGEVPDAAVYGGAVACLLWMTLHAVMIAVIYHDLRQVKEGVGIEELAKVFD